MNNIITSMVLFKGNMKPNSQLFIDGADPAETRKAQEFLKTKKPEWGIGIQGQTTNPTLVAKNPEVQKYLQLGKKLTQQEALNEYRKIVHEIAKVTSGPISIQVIADAATKKEEMIDQARKYTEWIPNSVIKFPCTGEGIAAAETFCQIWSVNITLNFSQEQAAAVYAGTKNAKHKVFVSPFAGRLDDRGENGMQVIENELKMFQQGDKHVDILAASIRTFQHLLYALKLAPFAITIPFKIFNEWQERDFELPGDNFSYDTGSLKSIPYQEISLYKDWRSFDLNHQLTDIGLIKFMEDWQSIIS